MCLAPVSLKCVPPKIVPCGRCYECRSSYKSKWAIRLLHEYEKYPSSTYFLTLTYSDEYLPDTTIKRDIQLFVKLLRKKGQKIRYYCSAELGEKTNRPHYHMIIYNLNINDIDSLKNSNYIRSAWKKGNIYIVPVIDMSTINYVVDYSLKKYDSSEKSAFWSLMSVRPPLGNTTKWNMRSSCFQYNNIKYPIPRIYKQKNGIASDDPELKNTTEKFLKQSKSELLQRGYNFQKKLEKRKREVL